MPELNTIPPDDPRYAGTEATTGTDETAGQAAKCDHPSCGATRAEYDRDPCKREVCGLRDATEDRTDDQGGPVFHFPPCPDPSAHARSAADADRAGEDVYLAAARAGLIESYGPRLKDLDERAAMRASRPWLRVMVDFARAPLLAELAEARAKVDGGEWQWGVRWDAYKRQPIDWFDGWTEDTARSYAATHTGKAVTLVRRYIGPAVLVTDTEGDDRD